MADRAKNFVRSRQKDRSTEGVRGHNFGSDSEVFADTRETANEVLKRDGEVFGEMNDYFFYTPEDMTLNGNNGGL